MSPLYKPLRQREFFRGGRATFDSSNGPQTVTVAPRASVSRDVVAAWDVDPRVRDRKAELAHRQVRQRVFANPPLLCSRIPEGAVATQAGVTMTADGRWIFDSVGVGVREVAETRFFRRIRLDVPRRVVDEDVAVIYSVLSEKKLANYYHWIVEGLARAAMLEHAGVPNSVRLLVPEPVLELHRTWLAAIGIDEERVLPWSGEPTRFRTVYLPSGPQHSGSTPIASAISFLRAHAARSRTAVPDRRLWISRRLAKRRRKRMGSEADLLAVAENMGFEEIVAESLTPREQIELFAQAEAIGGLHGAGLANAVFMAPATAVVEAAPESLKPRQKPLFWNLAAAARQNYAYCVGPAEGIDPKRFEWVLAKLLA